MSSTRRVGSGRHPSARRRSKVIRMLTPTGPVLLEVRSRMIRGQIAKHLNAVRRYLEIGDDRKLREFAPLALGLKDGRRIHFVTDPATLDRLAEGAAIHFELYRR